MTSQEPWPDSLHGCFGAEDVHDSVLKNIGGQNQDKDENEEKKNIVKKNTEILHTPDYDYQIPHKKSSSTNSGPEDLMNISLSSSDNSTPAITNTGISTVTTSTELSLIQKTCTDRDYTSTTDICLPLKSLHHQPSPPSSNTNLDHSPCTKEDTDTFHCPTTISEMFSLKRNNNMFNPASNINPGVFPVSNLTDVSPFLTTSTDIYPNQPNSTGTSSQSPAMESKTADNSYPLQTTAMDVFHPPPPPFAACSDISADLSTSSEISFVDAPSTDLFSSMTSSRGSYTTSSSSSLATSSKGLPHGLPQSSTDIFYPPPHPFYSCADVYTSVHVSSENDPNATDSLPSSTSTTEMSSSSMGTSTSDNYSKFSEHGSDPDTFNPPPPPFQSLSSENTLPTDKNLNSTISQTKDLPKSSKLSLPLKKNVIFNAFSAENISVLKTQTTPSPDFADSCALSVSSKSSTSPVNKETLPDIVNDILSSSPMHSGKTANTKDLCPTTKNRNSPSVEKVNSKTSNINNNPPISTSTEMLPLSTPSDTSALSTSAGISPFSSPPDVSPFRSPTKADRAPPLPPLPPPPQFDTDTLPITTPVTDISSSVSFSPDIYPLTNNTSDDIPVTATASDVSSLSTDTDGVTQPDVRNYLPTSVSNTSTPPRYSVCQDTHPFASKTITFPPDSGPKNVDRYTFSFESENSPPPSSSSDDEPSSPVFPVEDISPTKPINMDLYPIAMDAGIADQATSVKGASAKSSKLDFTAETDSGRRVSEVRPSLPDNENNSYPYTDTNDNILHRQTYEPPFQFADNPTSPLILPKFDISLLCTDEELIDQKERICLHSAKIEQSRQAPCPENRWKCPSMDIYPFITSSTNAFSSSVSSSDIFVPSSTRTNIPHAVIDIHTPKEDESSLPASLIADDNNNINNNNDNNNNNLQPEAVIPGDRLCSTSSESSFLLPSEDIYPHSLTSTDHSYISRDATNSSSSLSTEKFFTPTSMKNHSVKNIDLSSVTDISSTSSDTSFYTTCVSPMREKVFPDIANNNFSLTKTPSFSSTTMDTVSSTSILSSPNNNNNNNVTSIDRRNSTMAINSNSLAVSNVKASPNLKRSSPIERPFKTKSRSGLQLDLRASFSDLPLRDNKQTIKKSSLFFKNKEKILANNNGSQQLRENPVKLRSKKPLHSASWSPRSTKSFRHISQVNQLGRYDLKTSYISLPSSMQDTSNITTSSLSDSINLYMRPGEVKEFRGLSFATKILPMNSGEWSSLTFSYIPSNINQSTSSCIFCTNANLPSPPNVFTNQLHPTTAMDLLPAYTESFPFIINRNKSPTTVTISFPGSSWDFSFITYPGATYPELMEISSPNYDYLFSHQENFFTSGQTKIKYFLDLTQLNFLGQRIKTDSSQNSSTGRSLVSCLESLKLPPEKCLTDYLFNLSSPASSSANVFSSSSDYVQLVVRILCECRRHLWSRYVPTLVCPSDAPPRVTPAEHKLCPKLMPSSDDSFKSLVVSGKLFQEVLSKDFLSIFIGEFFTSKFPGSFYPGILPLSLSSGSGREAMSNRGELRNLFQRCLLAAEDSIRCLRWDDLMSTPPPALPGDPEQPLIYRGVEDDENNLADTDKLIHFDGSLSFLGDVALEEGESLSTPSSPRSPSSTYSQKQKRLVYPKGIKDLDYKLLQSGISIYPGSQALDGSAVGFVFSSSPLWRNQQITSVQLAQQFLYFSSLSRKHGKSRGLTLVADVRGSTSSTVNTLLEALHLFQTNSGQDLQTVYLLVNEDDQSLIKGSPLYDIHGPLKIDLLFSFEMLQSYIAMDQLPQAFDGQLDYNHESWVRFQMKLEPFVADCQLVSKYLKDSLSNITTLEKMPSTYDETNRLLWEHEQQVRTVFDAPQLLLLQEEGDTILNQLQQEEAYLGHSQDYKEEMLHVKKMYKQLQNSMVNLVKVAETRFHKLEQGLQLRGFENECNKLNIWISTEGRYLLNKYSSCIDNLKSAKMLEDQFLKDYFSAMAYIDKGNDLVEEACMLSQSGDSTDSATGYRDIVKSLKIHLKTFVDELEETRIKVEGTAKTYHTLDKAYAWALESMKYVVSMKTENCTTEEKLDVMLHDMDTFIQEHPPISSEVFAETLNQAKQLKNEKLISQCQRTIARCEETQSKLNSRKNALQRAKVQLLKAKSDSPCNCIVKSSGPDIDDPYLLAPAASKKTSSWHVTCTSLPTSPKLHPRRSSLPNKGEIIQVSPISNLSSQNMEEYQEQLFNDGLITEDMSHRIVTSLPKSLTLRPVPDTNDCDTHSTREGGLFSRLPFSKKHMTRTVTVPVAQSHSMSQMHLSSSQTIPQMDGYLTIEPLPRTMSLILQELISTERDYVWALQLIVENYIPEIKKEDVPQALRGKRNVIFGNIEKIYEFHSQHFLQELENCKRQPFQIAQTFLSHEEQFYLYALYNKNKPKSDQLMQEHGNVYFRRKQSELNDKMNLSSYLLRPVQRMGKYALLLKQMLKECPESDNEFADLKNSEEMVKFHLRHGNDLLAMDSLKDCDVNLQEQGRLLRQDEFIVTQGRKKFMRHIFLFEELILFSKTKRNRQGGPESYIYKYSFKTSDMGLTENFRDKSNKFEIWFRRRSLGENYILHAQCPEMKNSWVGEISRLLWKRAIKNRESRKCEMASMGMGNKPCMDLKGDFNINDRLINVTPTQSLVTSVDHFRNGNKRPISITSLSSTSSSSSGQSANHGLLNSLSLAFEALNAGSNTATDSPHFNRRSMNSSNESGICTDMFLEGDVSMSSRGILTGSNSAATLPANIRLLPTSAIKEGVVADSSEKKEKPIETETPVSTAASFTPPTTSTPKQADPGRLWLDLSKIRTPPEFKVRVLGPSQPKISSINAEESEV